ncbi:azurin [Pseudoxanthomonas sp. 3HH-4]|uniref:azurin n=1 Tax=Pseudoxanthomonas sp. 3HH-4 TaxID=1690214 RepID=UPI0011520C6E|nr:azurin [Pseudoxanthomonas sp. 3HH-4]TQM16791.1 azurin [Pseudoxanthomonas sp. 3HH-4]
MPRLLAMFALLAFSLLSVPALARSCAVTVEATDMMTFNLKTIRVPGDCVQLRVVLKHTGRMPAQAMGHNWVLAETRHHRDLGLAGGRMKLADDYLPRNDARVIAHTPVIGGGQATEVVFPTSLLRRGGDYTFFCTFPGHWNMMKGKLVFE